MTNHIGDTTQMVPMTQQRLDEITARAAKPLTRDDYMKLKLSDIARMRLDIKRLLAEVERIRDSVDQWENVIASPGAVEDLQRENGRLADEIERLREAQRWIPVSEGVPEIGQKVKLCRIDGHCEAVYRPDHNPFYPWNLDDGLIRSAGAVTHWMPTAPDGIGRKGDHHDQG